MRQESKKRAAKRRREAGVRTEYLVAHPYCEAARAGAPGVCFGRLAVHEPLTRARGGSTGDPANMRTCCAGHNTAISQNVETMRWAYRAGFLKHAWEGVG
ncbi:hypothetical protein LCGC14_2132120 [marine sediment metagenome]|uniref:HNH endonuclease n=1 Tax=marine sediment metagenome TaxID=412755 RepID=A0A0F9EN66_9ZZZZ